MFLAAWNCRYSILYYFQLLFLVVRYRWYLSKVKLIVEAYSVDYHEIEHVADEGRICNMRNACVCARDAHGKYLYWWWSCSIAGSGPSRALVCFQWSGSQPSSGNRAALLVSPPYSTNTHACHHRRRLCCCLRPHRRRWWLAYRVYTRAFAEDEPSFRYIHNLITTLSCVYSASASTSYMAN